MKAHTPGAGQNTSHQVFPLLLSEGKPLEAGSAIYLHGWDLLLHGYPWEAHEAWEHVWKVSTGPTKKWLQGLIRLAAALVKARVGQPNSVRHHLNGALNHWEQIPDDDHPHGKEMADALKAWLGGEGGAKEAECWLELAAQLEEGMPGPVLLAPNQGGIPQPIIALLVAFRQEIASNTAP